MRVHDRFIPRTTRVSRPAINRMHAKLGPKPKSLYLRLTEHDWAMSWTNYSGAILVGRYTESVMPQDLHADVEFAAQGMVREMGLAA